VLRKCLQPTLETDRLLLRPYKSSDFAAVHAYGKNPEISLHMTWGPNTEDMTRAFLRTSIKASSDPEARGYCYAIDLKDTGALIGGCSLVHTNREEKTAMIGYAIDKPYWGRGYTTEAAAALLRLGFEKCGLHRIRSWCTPENTGSWRVMEKIGMRREGHEREAVFIKGEWRDWFQYAILDWEWKAKQGG
jgi:[ribosomal protein S5]-alanine N-acetyltransferase